MRHQLRAFVASVCAIGLAVSVMAESGDKIDVTGDWDFAVETSEGSGNPAFSFKQDGEKLTGKYKGGCSEKPMSLVPSRGTRLSSRSRSPARLKA